MTSSHFVVGAVLACVILGGSFFLGHEQGKQQQAKEYAEIVSGVVDILIRGTADD
jgi:hypothetical protein